ncbi:MAG: pyridoxal phosphate-dependent aminotransferase [Halobacteriota archaeon]
MRVTVRDDLKRVTPCEHGGKIIEASKTMPDVLDFSANFNPYPHPRITSAVKQASQAVYQYPEHTYKRFRESIGAYLMVSSDAIVPGNGSVELIRLCTQALLEKGDKVIIPAPTFSEYELASLLRGAEPTFVPYWNEHEFKRDLFSALADEDIRMVFLCNPNNPTGKILSWETVTEIAAQCRATQTFLFVDEVFIELADPRQSIVHNDLDDVFILRSLTKSFSIPGIRAGYGVTNPALAQVLNAIRLPWNLNSIAEALTVTLLKDSEPYLEASRTKIAAQRRWLTQELAKISGLEPLESDVNFVIVNVFGTSLSSSEFASRMKRCGYLIRDCSSFRLTGHDYIRVAVRNKAENARLLNAIKRVVDKKEDHHP